MLTIMFWIAVFTETESMLIKLTTPELNDLAHLAAETPETAVFSHRLAANTVKATAERLMEIRKEKTGTIPIQENAFLGIPKPKLSNNWTQRYHNPAARSFQRHQKPQRRAPEGSPARRELKSA